MTKQELRKKMELWRQTGGNRNNMQDTIVDYLLADDEPTQPVDPYAWVRALPNNTPVEAKVMDVRWDLWYVYDGSLHMCRDGKGVTHELEHADDIRWPLPPDEWAWARKCHATHIIVCASGDVTITRNPSQYPIGDVYVAHIPIPEAIHD